MLKQSSMVRYLAPFCYPLDRSGLRWDGMNHRDATNHVLMSIADKTSGETIESLSFYRDEQGLFWLGTSFGIYQVKLAQNHFLRLAYQEHNKQAQAAIRGITALGGNVFVNLEKSGLSSESGRFMALINLEEPEIFASGNARNMASTVFCN